MCNWGSELNCSSLQIPGLSTAGIINNPVHVNTYLLVTILPYDTKGMSIFIFITDNVDFSL